MNPWAGLIVVIALLLIIIAWKGTQDNVVAALLNRPYKNSTVGGVANTSGGQGTATLSTFAPPTSAAPPTTPGNFGNVPFGSA